MMIQELQSSKMWQRQLLLFIKLSSYDMGACGGTPFTTIV